MLSIGCSLAGEPDAINSAQQSPLEESFNNESDSKGGSQDSLPSLAGEGLDESVPLSDSLDLSRPYYSFEEENNWVDRLWGRPFRDRLYLGMWTLHFSSGKDQEDENQLLGVSWNGYYGGTFINTHSDRVISAGWQRTLFQQRYGEVEVEAGYRAGMMYGYTKYLQLFETRFFPLFQTLLDIEYKQFGIEFSWAGVVFTAGIYYRF
ncbi:MAG: hypothetical protein ACR2PT_07235 [Endozoicomonas sp.]